MPILTLDQTIDRPAAAVFHAITALDDFPKWNPSVKRAEKISPGAPKEGSRFAFWVRGFGRTEQTLEEFDANKRVRIVPHSPKFTGGHRFVLKPQGKATRVEHELELRPRGAMTLVRPFLGPLMRKNLNDTANALKAYLEHGNSPATP